ncbi:MAG: hypothetical protein HY296_00300 [Thaumarchaeota archaeon]|nr:hypothetical protein [Nitrososphaerota archaeon]
MNLSDQSAGRLSSLVDVASSHGSLITLRELLMLLPESISEEELQDAIKRSPQLSSKYYLDSGFVTKAAHTSPALLVEAEQKNRMLVVANLRSASRFSALLHSTPFSLLSVSGSTSYGSASWSKDLDLFCVAPRGRMWTTLTQALIMARVWRLFHRSEAAICLSCTMDELYAQASFSGDGGPLFARDALEVVVLKGEDYFRQLLRRAGWMAEFFPTLFALKTARGTADRSSLSSRRFSGEILERFLYVVVGAYVRMRADCANRKLAKEGNFGSVFRAMAGRDHLIYESNRYANLRKRYANFRKP